MSSTKTNLGVVPRILALTVSGVLLLGLSVSALSALLLRGAAAIAGRQA